MTADGLPDGWTVTEEVNATGSATEGANGGRAPTPDGWFKRMTWVVRDDGGAIVVSDGSRDAAVSQALSILQSGGRTWT